MVTLGDSSVSVCASANLQCVVWTRTNKGGQLCSWGIYFQTYIHRWEGLEYSAHYVVEIRGRPLWRVTVQNVPCLLFGTLVLPLLHPQKKKTSPKTEMKTWRLEWRARTDQTVAPDPSVNTPHPPATVPQLCACVCVCWKSQMLDVSACNDLKEEVAAQQPQRRSHYSPLLTATFSPNA